MRCHERDAGTKKPRKTYKRIKTPSGANTLLRRHSVRRKIRQRTRNVKGGEQRMVNAIRIRMRMKEKSEQIDQEERERKIVSLMQQGFKRAEIAKTLGLTSDEVYQVTRLYRLELSKQPGGLGKAVRIKGLM